MLHKVKHLIHMIADKNGKEFVKHGEIVQKLELNFYFCKLYRSRERGANEKTKELISQ